MFEIEHLNWDTNFFGYNIGCIKIKDCDNFDIDHFLKRAATYKLVYIFSEEELNYRELKLVDKKVDFLFESNDINVPTSFDSNIQSFNSSKHNKEELLTLGLKSGVYSRFNLDPNFKNNEYTRLYKEWILKSINGKLAFDIPVYVEDNQIIGFTTILHRSKVLAGIGLVAVKEAARGKGVGMALINQTIQRAREKQYRKIEVVTQLNNIPAVRLYQKSNFSMKQITYIYHYWNYDPI